MNFENQLIMIDRKLPEIARSSRAIVKNGLWGSFKLQAFYYFTKNFPG